MKKTLCLCALFMVMLCTSKANGQTISSDFVEHACDSETFFVYTSSSGSTLSLDAYFGDGTMHSYPLDSFWYTGFGHVYSTSGLYSVKFVLLDSGSPVDSATLTDTVGVCQMIPLTAYLDNNSNCIYDFGDNLIIYPYTVEVDSAGIPIDTITATSIYYPAYGPAGTIYAFKVLTPPGGLVVTCPTAGIVYDTIGTSTGARFLGFECSTATGFDLKEIVDIGGPGRHMADVYVEVDNEHCTAHAATLTVVFSPKYNFSYAYPTPTSVVGNIITWDFAAVSEVAPQFVSAHFDVPSTWLIPGDTIQSSYVVTPITGDLDPTNNTVIRVDTVTSSYDPNEKSVTPQGVIAPGTQLDYKILFENTGNAPAVNIHVQDTLSNNVDINTFKLESSTSPVFTSFVKDGAGHNVIKFDFPHINLLDSSHHGHCDGMVTYTIKAKTGLAVGTVINNTAGIYFDDNMVVMTNTATNVIGANTSVPSMSNVSSVAVYPNPVKDVLTINMNNKSYSNMKITNTIGQVVMAQQVNGAQLNVNVKSFAPGMYYVVLSGESGVSVQKFEKL